MTPSDASAYRVNDMIVGGYANGHELGGTNRDDISKQMTPADISKAQAVARECMNQVRVLTLTNDKTPDYLTALTQHHVWPL